MSRNPNIPLTVEGKLHIYTMKHPSDETKDGEIKVFRDTDQMNADRRAAKVAKINGCTGAVRRASL